MPLRIASQRRFRRSVTVHADGDDQTFKVVFNALSDGELDVFETGHKSGQVALLRAAIADIEDVVDADGAPVTYSHDLLEQMTEYSDIRTALLREFTLGLVGARQGN